MENSESLKAEIASLEKRVQLAQAVERLYKNKDFQALMEHYLDDGFITNGVNYYTARDRERIHESLIARSHFKHAIELAVENGLIAADSLMQLHSEYMEQNEGGE